MAEQNEMEQRNNTAQLKLTVILAQHGITNKDETATKIQDIISKIPPALAETMTDMTNYEKALAFAPTYFTDGSTPDPSQGRVTEPAASTMSTEDKLLVQDYLDSHAMDTGKRASLTHVTAVLTDKPVLAEIIATGAKLTPSINESTEANFVKWGKVLVDTPENKKQFEEMKAAFTKGELMEVFVSTDAREKQIGFKVDTIDDNEQPTTEILDKDGAKAFLMVKVSGVIPAKNENSIGIRLHWSAAKVAVDNENGAAKKGTTNVLVINRKAMQENKDLRICTSSIVMVNGQPQYNENYNAKTAKYFEILTGKKNSEGKDGTRKVRLSGKTRVKAVERIEEYQPVFGNGASKGGSGLTKKDKQKVQEALLMAYGEAMTDTSKVSSDLIRHSLSEINRTKRTTVGAYV